MATSPGPRPVIRTPDQRLRVFVSSTLGEMAAERAAVRAAIERLRFIPVMFELGARPHPPGQLYRAYLEQSQVFVGLYWERYGWVAPDESVSGLEDEFILSEGMPRLMYMKEPAPERDDRLTEMLGRLSGNADVSYSHFSTPEELAELVEQDLVVLLSERFEAALATPAGRAVQAAPALPAPLTPTVGRVTEVAAVADLVRGGARLVTITGTGGVGKTRIAVEAARALDAELPEVRFVRLGSIADPSLVLATIADGLDVKVERSEPVLGAITARLGDTRTLLVLDNFEQVTDASTDLAALLDRCPGTQILVTSRHVLRVRGEREYPLAPLAVPGDAEGMDGSAGTALAETPAVALFVDHARAARPAFELTDENCRSVAELCRRLDGLPLAIELVAARVRLLPPAALLERLGNSLDLLGGGANDLPERQRTLRGTLDWSHQLLRPEEQALFRRMGVFTGGATLEAVEAVCSGAEAGDVLETLSSLLEKSLVVTVEDPRTGPRIGMLQTVRAYAWEQLAASDEIVDLRQRHAEWFADLAESADPSRIAGATTRWPALGADQANLRAAIKWAFERDDVAMLGRLAASLWAWYWLSGRMAEGRGWIEDVGARLDDAPTPETAARIGAALGAERFTVGDHDAAEPVILQALTTFESCDDVAGAAAMSLLVAVLGPAANRIDEALAHARRAVDAYRSLGLDWGLAYALSILGFLLGSQGDTDAGRALQEEALGLARRIGEEGLAGQALTQLALAHLGQGKIVDAHQLLVEAADSYRSTRHLEGTAYCLEVGAGAATAEARPVDAVRMLAAADAIRDRIDMPVWPALREQRQMLLDALAAQVGAELFAATTEEGRAADPFTLLPA